MTTSRRAFIRFTAGLAAAAAHPLGARYGVPLATSLAGLGALAAHQARAANTNDGYKALVCLFLAGGNDSHNWLVPTDAASAIGYATARGGLAWPQAQLQPIISARQANGRGFGMPQDLAPLRDWYQRGQLAWLANVGTLARPVTKADYQASLNLPAKLYSHNDQQASWQSLQPEGAPTGWGGRIGDLLMSANRYPVFTTVSANGNAVFLSGNSVSQYQVGGDGPVLIEAAQSGWHAGSSGTSNALRGLLAGSGANDVEAEYMKVVQRSLATANTLKSALAGAAVPALSNAPIALASDSLARQLRVVAQMIAAAPVLGMRRQVFMVSMGGFDSHANQMRDQPLLMARVAHGVNWFLQALLGQGLLNKVMLFSASDFGRTLTSNGDGCDHGWGSHHFVAGGAVKGGDIYGRFPISALGTSEDVGSGRLLPSTGVTELAAALGGWMGLSQSELTQVLPNLGYFNTSNRPAFV